MGDHGNLRGDPNNPLDPTPLTHSLHPSPFPGGLDLQQYSVLEAAPLSQLQLQNTLVTQFEQPPPVEEEPLRKGPSTATRIGKRKKLKKPKRSRTAYAFFCSLNRDKFASEAVDASSVTKILKEKWKEADRMEKKRFKSEALKDKARYRRELSDYEAVQRGEFIEDDQNRAKLGQMNDIFGPLYADRLKVPYVKRSKIEAEPYLAIQRLLDSIPDPEVTEEQRRLRQAAQLIKDKRVCDLQEILAILNPDASSEERRHISRDVRSIERLMSVADESTVLVFRHEKGDKIMSRMLCVPEALLEMVMQHCLTAVERPAATSIPKKEHFDKAMDFVNTEAERKAMLGYHALIFNPQHLSEAYGITERLIRSYRKKFLEAKQVGEFKRKPGQGRPMKPDSECSEKTLRKKKRSIYQAGRPSTAPPLVHPQAQRRHDLVSAHRGEFAPPVARLPQQQESNQHPLPSHPPLHSHAPPLPFQLQLLGPSPSVSSNQWY